MKKNKNGFSVLVSILIIGFLMVLTVGTFNIVLRELNDSKGAFDYLKAFSAAEAAEELALLKIKENGYGYYDKVDLDINDYSVVLSKNPTDKSKFNKAKEPLIAYDLNSKVNSYNGELGVGKFDIIPLFYIDNGGTKHLLTNFELEVNSSNPNSLTWNLLSSKNGISGVGEIDSLTKGKGRDSSTFDVVEQKISDFLSNENSNPDNFNYLILMNIDSAFNSVEYTLKSTNTSEYFTLPRINILATGKVGKYKQNLNIFLDNTEYLGRSRYSIYSN